MPLNPALVCMTPGGESTARRIADTLGYSVHGRRGRTRKPDVFFDSAVDHVQALYLAGTPVIGVFSSGILIRALAPHIAGKRVGPPALCVSEDGSAAVPLLGAHHGGNEIAWAVSRVLGISPSITSAGDISLGVALDSPPPGYALSDPEGAVSPMAKAVSEGGVRVSGESVFGLDSLESASVEVCVTEGPASSGDSRLVYHPLRHALGIGCSRGADSEEVWGLVQEAISEAGIAQGSIACVSTVSIKADERCVNEISDRLGRPLRLFSPSELEKETPRLQNPSEAVFREIGCHGVAEAAALALAGPDSELVAPKRKSAAATCAIARSPDLLVDLSGSRRGELAVVGIGPGKAEWRAPECSDAVARADEIVGYGLYLDLLGPIARGKNLSRFSLGEEEERCRHALECAAEGKRVALVCSGDSGIYAMGSLALELMCRTRNGVSDQARRVKVRMVPGISAMQAAAAAAGAPLGHDFCAVSLSDLLTPAADIERRLRAAAEGDFVVALYNPASRKRRALLHRARDILLTRRPPGTPVLLAKSLGREGQSISYRRLDELSVGDVDMLTTVIVGSSATRLSEIGGVQMMYTPRGYALKEPSGAGPS